MHLLSSWGRGWCGVSRSDPSPIAHSSPFFLAPPFFPSPFSTPPFPPLLEKLLNMHLCLGEAGVTQRDMEGKCSFTIFGSPAGPRNETNTRHIHKRNANTWLTFYVNLATFTRQGRPPRSDQNGKLFYLLDKGLLDLWSTDKTQRFGLRWQVA